MQIKEARPFDFVASREGGMAKIENNVEELQVVVKDLAILYGLASKALREDSFEVLEYVWLFIAEVIKAVDRLNNRVQVWKEVLGDFSFLREEKGAINVCSELTGILGQIDALELGLSEQLDNLLVRFDVWEGDNISNLTYLNDKIKGLMKIQAPPPPPVLTQAPFSLCLTTLIADSNGMQIGVFGDVMDELATLKANNVRLSDHLDAIKVDLTAQGGVVFGQHTFTSELQMLQVAMLECPRGDAFSLFVDPILLFCHDAMYSPCASWQKDTKAMEESGFMLISDHKVVALYNLNTPWWFSEGTQVTGERSLAPSPWLKSGRAWVA